MPALGDISRKDIKLVSRAINCFYGIGPIKTAQIMAKFSLHRFARMGSLSPKTLLSLNAELAQLTTGDDARRIVQENIQKLKAMDSYRGRRHFQALPVRGQRTRCQTETARKFNRLGRVL